jgi:hypothetical protein
VIPNQRWNDRFRVLSSQHGASATVAYFGFIDTDMVRDSFADPLTQRFETTFPRYLRKRLPPSAAGAAIVGGIRHTDRNATIQGILRDADVPRAAVEAAVEVGRW